jgi:hypothetical protein
VTAPLELLRTAYGDLSGLLHRLAAHGAEWTPTGCRGCAVHDLAFHLLGDAAGRWSASAPRRPGRWTATP